MLEVFDFQTSLSPREGSTRMSPGPKGIAAPRSAQPGQKRNLLFCQNTGESNASPSRRRSEAFEKPNQHRDNQNRCNDQFEAEDVIGPARWSRIMHATE